MATYASSAAGGDTAGTTDRFAAITPAVNDLLVVYCAVRANTNATPTASDNQGGTYTRVNVAAWGASTHMLSAFVRDALISSAVSHTITVATGSNGSGCVVPVAIAGMTKTGSTAIRQSAVQANQGSTTTPAPAFGVAALTGNLTLGGVGNNVVGGSGLTPPTSWTSRQDTTQITPDVSLQVVTRDSGFTGTTITWGSASSQVYSDIIIELDTTGAAATPQRPWVDPHRRVRAVNRPIGPQQGWR